MKIAHFTSVLTFPSVLLLLLTSTFSSSPPSCWAYQSHVVYTKQRRKISQQLLRLYPHTQGREQNRGEESESAVIPHVMRAWTCHGRNQTEMVDRLRQAGIIRSEAVAAVMTMTDRQHYVPRSGGQSPIAAGGSLAPIQPYQDSPIPIGLGQTISAPHMHAYVLEEILPYVSLPRTTTTTTTGPVTFLDVGCGSGYITACFGRWLKARDTNHSETIVRGGNSSLLGRTGHVYGIDIHEHLVELTRSNLLANDGDLLHKSDSGSTDAVVSLHTANGWEGLPHVAPFDAIHVGASAATIPVSLLRQLKVGGVMIVPIGPAQGAQTLYKIERLSVTPTTIDRTGTSAAAWSPLDTTMVGSHSIQEGAMLDETEFRMTQLLGVRYVPLIEQPISS